jgi:hypothetical protein
MEGTNKSEIFDALRRLQVSGDFGAFIEGWSNNSDEITRRHLVLEHLGVRPTGTDLEDLAELLPPVVHVLNTISNGYWTGDIAKLTG